MGHAAMAGTAACAACSAPGIHQKLVRDHLPVIRVITSGCALPKGVVIHGDEEEAGLTRATTKWEINIPLGRGA